MPNLGGHRTAFSQHLEELMALYSFSGKDLAASIGVSETSVSRFIRAQNRPRPKLLNRICDVLCKSDEERALLIAAYAQDDKANFTAAPQVSLHGRSPDQDQSASYLDQRAVECRLERETIEILQAKHIEFEKSPLLGDLKTDLLIHWKKQNIAAEFYAGSLEQSKLECLGRILESLKNGGKIDHALALIPCQQMIEYVKLSNGTELMSLEFFQNEFLRRFRKPTSR